MPSNSSGVKMAAGFAVFGLALVAVGGWWFSRRQRAGRSVGSKKGEMEAEVVMGDEETVLGEDLPEDGSSPKKLSADTSQVNQLLKYFLYLFVLSIPLWLFGGGKLPLPINLPVSSFIWINPAIAASILSYQHSGFDGVKGLWKKAFDFMIIPNKDWIAPSLFLMPLIYFLSYGIGNKLSIR